MRQMAVYRESKFERTTRLLGLFLLVPLLVILTLPVILGIAHKPDFGFSANRMEVVEVVPGGAAELAGIRLGDEIIALDNVPLLNMPAYYAALSKRKDLSPLPIEVLRGAIPRLVVISPTEPRQALKIRSYGLWASGLAFLMIGSWVLLRRVDPVARNFFSLCLIFAFFLMDIPDHSNVVYMTVKELLRYLFQLLLPAYFLRFFLQFPSPRSRLAREKKQ